MTRKNCLTLLLLCLTAQWAIAIPGTQLWNGQEILTQTNAWGMSICDSDGRPLAPVWGSNNDFQHWQFGPNGPVPFHEVEEFVYLNLSPEGDFVPSGMIFPSANPPATEGLLRQFVDAQRQAFNLNSGVPLPIVEDVRVTFVPLTLYCEIDGVVYFDDETFWTHPEAPGQPIDFDLWYDSRFAPEMPAGAQTPMGREMDFSLPAIWENNQDVVVSRILPDTERCSWYGDRPGVILDPATNAPFRFNMADMMIDVSRLFTMLEESGVNLQNINRYDAVIYELSGNHFLTDVNSSPAGGFSFINAWVRPAELMNFEPVDQTGPAWIMRALLHLHGYKDTFIDMSADDGGSDCWDLMGFGYCGYARNARVSMASLERHLYEPALWNPVDRRKAGWLQNAVLLEEAGTYVLDGQSFYLEDPTSDEELHFYSWSTAPSSQMRNFPLNAESFGSALAFASHNGQHVWWEGLEAVPEIIRSESISLDGDNFWPWDETQAAFPSANNSSLAMSEWTSTGTPFSWQVSFSVNENLQTVLHLDNAPADQVALVAQDGMWQREVPLGYQGNLLAPMYNVGLPVQQVQMFVGDEEGWVDFATQLSGNWSQNQTVPFLIPSQQLSLPSQQAYLGEQWNLDLFVQPLQPTGADLHLEANPIIGTPMSDFAVSCSENYQSASNGEYLAISDAGQVRVYYRSSLVSTWNISDIQDILLTDFCGSETPELIVSTHNQIRIWQLNGIVVPTDLSGWPVSGESVRRLMVIDDPELSDEGRVLAYVDEQYLLLRRPDGGIVRPSRTSIHLPSTILPVRQMAYMGGDALGPHFAVAGGDLTDPLLVTLDADGNEGLRITREIFGNHPIEVRQLLVGDFLNNGFYDLLAIIDVGALVPDEGTYQALLMASWSEAEQEWVYNIDYLRTSYTGNGPEAMVPLVSNSPSEATRVAFNFWRTHLNASPDSSMIVVCDFSQENWESEIEVIMDAELAHRYMLAHDLDDDGRTDMVAQKRGLGLEAWRGLGATSFEPWSDGALIHKSSSDLFPVPLMINAQAHFGQWEDGVLRFSNSLSTNEPSWPDPLGPGHTGQVRHLHNASLLPPIFDLRIVAGRPVLTFQEHAPCNNLKIYRSSEVYGNYELIATVPWNGMGGFQWQDNTLTGLPNAAFYQARVEITFNGPDGSSIR
ncbi:hypothetical protein KBC40_01560 [Patescibacteria group bacterium]|nr:hypothetical protein [Patescibacteria group bacterium]